MHVHVYVHQVSSITGMTGVICMCMHVSICMCNTCVHARACVCASSSPNYWCDRCDLYVHAGHVYVQCMYVYVHQVAPITGVTSVICETGCVASLCPSWCCPVPHQNVAIVDIHIDCACAVRWTGQSWGYTGLVDALGL